MDSILPVMLIIIVAMLAPRNRTCAKQTLASLCSPRRTFVLSSAPRLASAILRKSYEDYYFSAILTKSPFNATPAMMAPA